MVNPFRIPPAPNRDVGGRFRSVPAPNPALVRKEADAAGLDMQTYVQANPATRPPDHPVPAGQANGPMLPWPPATPGAGTPFRLR